MPAFDKILRGTPILPDNEPSELFHYTTGDGLRGILTSRTLWATEVTYLNDVSEFRYADELIGDIIKKLNISISQTFDLEHYLFSELTSNAIACHVACFCEDEDLLSQWRAYGRDGTGYAIAFDVRKLRALNVGDGAPQLGRVIYDKSTQMSIIEHQLEGTLKPLIGTYPIKDTIQRMVDEVVRTTRSPEEVTRIVTEASPQLIEQVTALIRPSVAEAATAMIGVRAFLKFPRFSEEREWRIVSIQPFKCPDLLFGTYRGILVPRLPLSLGEYESVPISRIIVGPSLHPREAGRSIRRFLTSLGLERIEVTSSPIPLRV